MKKMKIISKRIALCYSCMKEHEVQVVEVEENGTFKNEMVSFRANYEYCSNIDEYSETEEMLKLNSLAQKDAYRKKVKLLTSAEIRTIRDKYGISQKEFSEVLDWGKATITRYENHHVQDRAHDEILRMIDSDPQWFIGMLERAKERIMPKAYIKYYRKASEQIEKKRNRYEYNVVISMKTNDHDHFSGEIEKATNSTSYGYGLKNNTICEDSYKSNSMIVAQDLLIAV